MRMTDLSNIIGIITLRRCDSSDDCGVALVSRLLKIIGLFCKKPIKEMTDLSKIINVITLRRCDSSKNCGET